MTDHRIRKRITGKQTKSEEEMIVVTISQFMEKMIAFSNGNIHDIDHLIRVWTYAKTIGELEGLDPLKEAMKGALCCLTGQSGAGKSTLLNVLLGLQLETGEISRKISRGKNTTRQAELIEKDGLRVMDTAGFNLLEPEKKLEPEKLRERYPEFREFEGKCRFRECLHDREPGCAVQKAADEGCIHPERLARYRVLLQDAREEWRERYD